MGFQHETSIATWSLLYMLNGIRAQEAVYAQGVKPEYPDIRTFPRVADESLSDRLAPGGPVEQLAYRAWVTEVYGKIAEHHYRIEI